ncbi:flavin-containing oxidoreductase [Burkholderia pseudomallei]|nr:flavin-containing oxidoreductase [Burkholderia pseudomallei]ARK63183.1 flavin-containing oxidoreductase [Burkholderia pseudomallei]ARK68536.1 flavin-containing oxidoreductase [Burkholderia pseudomallei]ARK86548.1 flavin-containing oxidoreductase [Burkholderia pseudomallei]ARL02140.1 flavin-containing oxidoreductase [Burkholderia pseudomallei]
MPRASCLVPRASCLVRYRCTSFADRYGVLPFLFVRMK